MSLFRRSAAVVIALFSAACGKGLAEGSAGQWKSKRADAVVLTEAEWRERLTPDQFRILRQKGTERPFGAPYRESVRHGAGVYHCAGCDLPLFASVDKFDSGTGWPSFTRPIAKDAVDDLADRSYGMVRVENVCARCGGHLGHVFEDGPAPTGLRYCINGLALRFVPTAQPER